MCRSNELNMGPDFGQSSAVEWKCGAPDRAWAALRFERDKYAGLRNCQDSFGWHSGRPLTRPAGALQNALAEPAVGPVGGDEPLGWNYIKPILKMMVSGTAKKRGKWWCSGPEFLVICENDNMLRRSGMKTLGLNYVSLSGGTYHTCIILWQYPPPSQFSIS